MPAAKQAPRQARLITLRAQAANWSSKKTSSAANDRNASAAIAQRTSPEVHWAEIK
jgi:hypothetical protein